MELGDSIIGLLPLLVSGYLFNLLFYPFRFFTGRADGQRLFFMSAGSGLAIGAIAFGLSHLIAIVAERTFFAKWLTPVLTQLHDIIPISWVGSLLLTIFLGPILALLGNFLAFLIRKLLSRPDITTSRWIYGKMNSWFGSSLAQLLREAADDQKLVLINLCSRKVYCGKIIEAPLIVDGENSYIELLPKFSTYRNKDTLEMNKSVLEYPAFNLWETIRYRDERQKILMKIGSAAPDPRLSEAYERVKNLISEEIKDIEKTINEIAMPNFNARDWIKVIPCNQVESASFFDSDAFDTWFSNASGTERADR